MELSTYFRINAANTGQFERTLIVADDDSYVSLYTHSKTLIFPSEVSASPQTLCSSAFRLKN
jgi:Fe-S cluster assembly scaffold protein SufB